MTDIHTKIEAAERSWREATRAIERYREQGNIPPVEIMSRKADQFAKTLLTLQETKE